MKSVVITSKEPMKVEMAKNWLTIIEDENAIDKFHVEEKQTNVIWSFSNECDANFVARVFMNDKTFGFEYVKRG